jgi:hypothetical protein
MIVIRIGSDVQEFVNNQAAMSFVADTAGDRPLRFQRLVFENGNLEAMDFLTYNTGRISETFNTRS